MDGGSDPLLKILQTGMLKMEAKERLSAHECLKRVKTDLFSYVKLDIGGTTRAEGTVLSCEKAGKKSPIIVMGGGVQSKEPTRVANTTLQRTAQQDKVVDDNGTPSHQDEGVPRGQKTSNLDDNE